MHNENSVKIICPMLAWLYSFVCYYTCEWRSQMLYIFFYLVQLGHLGLEPVTSPFVWSRSGALCVAQSSFYFLFLNFIANFFLLNNPSPRSRDGNRAGLGRGSYPPPHYPCTIPHLHSAPFSGELFSPCPRPRVPAPPQYEFLLLLFFLFHSFWLNYMKQKILLIWQQSIY